MLRRMQALRVTVAMVSSAMRRVKV